MAIFGQKYSNIFEYSLCSDQLKVVIHPKPIVDMSKYEDDLTKLHDEISYHILTKRDLSEIEEELSKAVDAKKLQVSH